MFLIKENYQKKKKPTKKEKKLTCPLCAPFSFLPTTDPFFEVHQEAHLLIGLAFSLDPGL